MRGPAKSSSKKLRACSETQVVVVCDGLSWCFVRFVFVGLLSGLVLFGVCSSP